MDVGPTRAMYRSASQGAVSAGVGYRLAKVPMEAVFRARTISETRGFLKALIEEKGNRILGFTAFGAEAGEVMVVVQVAMLAGLPYTALRNAVLTQDDGRGARRPVLGRAARMTSRPPGCRRAPPFAAALGPVGSDRPKVVKPRSRRPSGPV
jgi:hypothetical protein